MSNQEIAELEEMFNAMNPTEKKLRELHWRAASLLGTDGGWEISIASGHVIINIDGDETIYEVSGKTYVCDECGETKQVLPGSPFASPYESRLPNVCGTCAKEEAAAERKADEEAEAWLAELNLRLEKEDLQSLLAKGRINLKAPPAEQVVASAARHAAACRVADSLDLTDEATSARLNELQEGLTPEWGYTEESALSAARYMLAEERVLREVKADRTLPQPKQIGSAG